MKTRSQATAGGSRASAPATERGAAGPPGSALLLLPLLVLVALCALLAAPGAALVPAAEPGRPTWILGPYGSGFDLAPATYLALIYLAAAAWLWVAAAAHRLDRKLLIGAGAGAVGLFTLAPPLLSLDLFSYLSYARLGAEYGLNPYEFVPADVPGDPVADRVEDFRFTPSVYGPLFTLISWPLGWLSKTAGLWGLKLIGVASVGWIALSCARLARIRGVDPAFAVAFVVLNPLTLIHLVGGAHNDGLMVALALAGALALASGRPATGAIGLISAVAVKVAAALYLPFAIAARYRDRRFLTVLAAAGAGWVAVGLVLFGPEVSEALGVAGNNQDRVSRWSVPATLSRGSGIDVDLIRAVAAAAYGLGVVWLISWVVRGGDWLRAAGWAAFGLLVASSSMVPWYLIWLLPFAAVSRDRLLIAGAVALTLFQAPNSIPL